MDKSKNKDDLREAGRKRLEEFRQRKLQKGNPAKNPAQTSKPLPEGQETSSVSIEPASEQSDLSTESFASSTYSSQNSLMRYVSQDIDREDPTQPALNTVVSTHNSNKLQADANIELDKDTTNPATCMKSWQEVHKDLEKPLGCVAIPNLDGDKIASISMKLDTSDNVVADLSRDDTGMAAAHHNGILASGLNTEAEKMDVDGQGTHFLKDEIEEGSLSGLAHNAALLTVPSGSHFGEKEVNSYQSEDTDDARLGKISKKLLIGTEVDDVSNRLTVENAAPCTSLSNFLLPVEGKDDGCGHAEDEAMIENLLDLAKHNDTALDFMERARNSEESKSLFSQLQDLEMSKSEIPTSQVETRITGEDADQIGTFYGDKRLDLSSQQVQGALECNKALVTEVDETKKELKQMAQDGLQQDFLFKEENAKLLYEVQQLSEHMHSSQVEKEQVIKELEEMSQKYFLATKEKEELCHNLSLIEKSTKDLAIQNSELDLKYQKLSAELEECKQKESSCSFELNLAKQQLQEAILQNDKFVYSFEECRQELEKMTTEKEDLTSSLMHTEMHILEVERENSQLLTMFNEKEQLWKSSLIKQAELEEIFRKEVEQTLALKESFWNLQDFANEKESVILQLKEQLDNIDYEKTKLCSDLESSRMELELLQHDNAGLKVSMHYLEESESRKQSCVSQLEEQLRKMEGQNSKLETDLEETRIELQTMKSDKLALQHSLGEYKSRFASLGDDKEKLLADFQSLKEAKRELFLVLEESKNHISENTKDVGELLRMVLETKDRLAFVTEEKKSLVSEIEKLHKKMEGEGFRHANEMEASCAFAQQLETERQMLCLQAKTTAEESLLLQGQVEDLRHHLQKEFDNRADLSSALETSRQQIMALSSELSELSGQMNDSSNDNEILTSQVEAFQKQMEEERLQSSSDMESLRFRSQELETEKQILLSGSEKLNLQLKDLTEESVVLQSEIEKLRQQLHELSDDKAILLSTVEASREQVMKLKSDFAEINDQLRIVENENDVIKGQYEAFQKQTEGKMKLRASEIESQSLEAEKEIPSESSELSSKLSEMGDELEKLGKEKELLVSQLETLRLQLEEDRIQQTRDFEEWHTLVQKMETEKQLLLSSIEASSLREKHMGEESVHLHTQINDLMQKLQDVSDDRDRLFTSLEISRVQLLNLEGEKSAAITSLARTEQLLQDSNKQKLDLLANYESSLQEMLNANDDLKHELDQHKQLAEQKDMEKKQFEEELKFSLLDSKELTRHKESLLLKLDEANEQLSFLRSEKDGALNQWEQLKNQLLLEEAVKGRLDCEVRQLQSRVKALEEETDKLNSEMSLQEQELQVQRKDKLHLEGQLQSVSGVLIQQSVETEVTKAQLTADLESSRESLRDLASKSAAETAELLAQIKELKMDVSKQNMRDADQLSQLRAHLYTYAKSSYDFSTTDIGGVGISSKYDANSQVASGVAKLVKAFEEKASSSCIDSQISDSEHKSHVSGTLTPPLETNAGKVVVGGPVLKPEQVLREDLEIAFQRFHDVEKERGELALALSRLEVFAAAQLQLNKELTDKVALLTMEHGRCVEESGHQTHSQMSSKNCCERIPVISVEQAAVLEFPNIELSNRGLTDKVVLFDESDRFVEQANRAIGGESGFSEILPTNAADSAVPQSLNRLRPEKTMSTTSSEFSERQEVLARLYDDLVIQFGPFSDDKIFSEQSSETVSLLDHRDWKKVIDMAHFTRYSTKILLEHIEYLQTTYSQCTSQIQQAVDKSAVLEAELKQLKSKEALDNEEKLSLVRSLQELSEKCKIIVVEFFQHSAYLGITPGGINLWKENNVIADNFGKLMDKFTVIKNQILYTSKDSELISDLTGLQRETAELVSFLDELGQQNGQLQLLMKGRQDEFTRLQQYGEDPVQLIRHREGGPGNSSIKVCQDISCSKEETDSLTDVRSPIEVQDVGQSHQRMCMETILQLLNGIHESVKWEKTRVQHDDLINELLEVSIPAIRDKYKAIIVDVDKLMENIDVPTKSYAPSSMEESFLVREMTDKSASEKVKLDFPGEKLDDAATMASEACHLQELLKQLSGLRDDLDLANKEKAKLEFELDQTEQKLSSTREKLSLAISKGKGLVQQRDALKHAFTTKSEEFDLLEASLEKEMQAKDARLQEMELKLRESEMAVDDAKTLQAELNTAKQNMDAVKGSLDEANAVQQKLETALGIIMWPLELTDEGLSCKVDWLLTAYLKFEDSFAVTVQNLRASENATNILRAELQDSQDKVEVLTEALAKQQQENGQLLNKLHNLSEELSSGTKKSDHEKVLLKTDLGSLKKRFDEQASALENVKETHVILCSALDNLLDNLQKFHFENFGEKIESSHYTDPVSRLDACIHMLLDKHKLSTEEFDELTQRTAAIVAETEQQRKEREENEQRHQKLMEKLALKDLELHDFSRKMEEAAMTMAFQEDEIQGFQHRLQRVREELQSASDERDRFQSELSEAEQKLLSLKEKLGLAVKKGKGLAQQRDALKQSLVEKTGELDLLVAAHKKKLQEKDALLDENGHKSHNLEKELVFSKGVLASIEHVFNNLNKPETLQLTNLADKVQWVILELDKAWYELSLVRKDTLKYEEANNDHSLAIERFEEAMDQAQGRIQSLDTENIFLKDAVNAKSKELKDLQQSLIEACEKRDFLAAELLQSTKASCKYSDEKQMLEAAHSEAWLQVGEAKKNVEMLKIEVDASLKSKIEAENNFSLVQEELLATRKRLEIAFQDLELKTAELNNMQAVLFSVQKKFASIFDQAESVLASNVDSIRHIHHVSLDVAAQDKSWNVEQSGLISLSDYADQLAHFQEKMKLTGPSVLGTSAPFSIFSVLGRQKSFYQSEKDGLKQFEDQFVLWRKRLEELQVSSKQEVSTLQQNLDKVIDNARLKLEAVGHHKEAEVAKLQGDILNLKSHIASKESGILSVLAERENLEHTVSSFKKAIFEKDEQYKNIMDSLASAENRIEELARKASKLEAKNLDLEKIATNWETKLKLTHQKLQLAEETEAHLRSAKEELATLQTVLSSKHQELERQSLVIQDAEKHISLLNVRVKGLEDVIEQKQMATVNLEASRSKAAAKLTTTLNKFSELWKQCESLLAEIEKLQHSLEIREDELSRLRQENAKADSEIQNLRDILERNNSEIFHLKSELSELLVVLGAAENGLFPPAETREILDVVPSVSPLTRMKEVVKHIGALKEEAKGWRAHAEKKDAMFLDLRKNLEVVQGEKALLQSAVNSKQMQLESFQNRYVSHPQSNATIIKEAPPVEIEEMGQRGKATLLHPSSSHIRGVRKPSHVAVDVDTENGLPQLDIDDKDHTFKPLMTSKFIPKATRVLAERLDGLFYGGGKLLMRQPLARLGISIYWIVIHLWILSIMSAAIY